MAGSRALVALMFVGLVSCNSRRGRRRRQRSRAVRHVTRRLTESQYRATVADIFAPDIAVVGRFERELRTDGLIAVGTSEAGMSAFSVEQYDASARGIAKEVVSKERRDKLVPCQPKSETDFDKACAKRVCRALRHAAVSTTADLARDEALCRHGALGHKSAWATSTADSSSRSPA